MKIVRKKIENFYFYYPNSVAIVGAKGKEKVNFMSAAWHMPISASPPIYAVAISKKRYTHRAINEAKEFTVNFVSYENVKISANLGRRSGKDMDKVEKFSINLSSSAIIPSPVLKDSYASFECKLLDVRTYGDHDLFVGEVLCVHELEGVFDENGIIMLKKIDPLLYLGKDIYATTMPDSQKLVLPD